MASSLKIKVNELTHGVTAIQKAPAVMAKAGA